MIELTKKVDDRREIPCACRVQIAEIIKRGVSGGHLSEQER